MNVTLYILNIEPTKKENKNNKMNNEINTSFWRNKITWRTANEGMNANVIREYSPSASKTSIIADIRRKSVPYGDCRTSLTKENSRYNTYFNSVVNDCLEVVFRGNKKGFVFNEDQLREVIKIIPSVSVKYNKDYEVYYCWRYM